MPTYDAEKCKRLIAAWSNGVHTSTSSTGLFDDAKETADQLLAATQEVERLRELEPAAKRNVRILVLHEKHGDRHFDASTGEMLDAAALAIVKERLDEGWYDDEETARAALLGGDRALQFLRGRRRAEYEGFDLVTPEVAKPGAK